MTESGKTDLCNLLFARPLRHANLQLRLQILIGTVLALLVMTMFSFALYNNIERIRNTLAQSAETEASLLVSAVSEPAVLGDTPAIQQILQRRAQLGGVGYLAFIEPGREQLTIPIAIPRTTSPGWFQRAINAAPPRVEKPIVFGGETYGTIVFSPSAAKLHNRLWSASLFGLVTFLLSYLLILWIIRQVLRQNLTDVAALGRNADLVRQGKIPESLPVLETASPEIRHAVTAFNQMSEQLGELLSSLQNQKNALDFAALVSESLPDGTLTSVNAQFCQAMGYEAEHIVGQNYSVFASGLHDQAFFDTWLEEIRAGRPWQGEVCNRTAQGTLIWLATYIYPLPAPTGEIARSLTLQFDITRRVLAEQSLRDERNRWQVTVNTLDDGVLLVARDGTIEFANPAAETMLAVPTAHLSGSQAGEILDVRPDLGDSAPPETLPRLSFEDIAHCNAQTCFLRRQDTSLLPVQLRVSPLGAGTGSGWVIVFRDDTERRNFVDELRWMAYRDPLTDLPNRRALEARLTAILQSARQNRERHVFAYIDLDNFKTINDSCGHAAGDEVLHQLPTILRQALPESAYLGRIGGDEFGLLLTNCTPGQAKEIGLALINALQNYTYHNAGQSFKIGASIGLCALDSDSTSLAQLFELADKACYAAKSSGSNHVVFSHPDV